MSICLSVGNKDTAYTPRRDDIQRLALMIYSRERLTIYTASRDYGRKSFFYNKVLLRLRGFLHALRLVEMTTRKITVISSIVLSFSGFEKPEESPGKVVLPCKKQLTKYRHLEHSREIP